MSFKSKKGFLHAFDISGRLGYYVLTILMVSVLFVFLAVVLQGTQVKFYKSNYGTSVMNLEEKAFNSLEYVDPLLNQKYSKVIDLEKVIVNDYKEEDLCGQFSSQMGVDEARLPKGVKLSLFVEGSLFRNISTCNFDDRRSNIEKHYPVLIRTSDDEYKLGEVRAFYFKP